MATQRILLFGDQADAPIPMIRRVVEKSKHSKNLKSFLQCAIDHVQVEVGKLTPVERETVGSFQSVQDLTTSLTTKSDRFGIAQMVLVHAENDPSLLSNGSHSMPLLSLGICGGLLPAATAAVATNVGELIEVASYLAGVNCRVAATISRRSVQIEDDTGSWAFSALGSVVSQLPQILEQFHKHESIPRHRQAYIAISTPTWATVFGPPSVLRRLLETSTTLKRSEISILPAFGAVHAGHLAAPDFDEIVAESPLLDRVIKPNFKLISGSKYEPFTSSTLRKLMPEILMDIFQNSTNPARLFEVGGSYLEKSKGVSLYMLGATSYLVLLRRSLHLQGLKVTLYTGAPSIPTSEIRGGSGAVAIIGMSGQFPGADSIDELWESLMRRDELHRKIPSERFNADDYLDETGRGKNAITSALGCFLERPGLFDHKMFNVSPREAIQMDPGQRLLMHAVYEALENSGVTNNGSLATDSKRIGTYIGDGSDDWRELQQPHGVDKYILQGTQRSFTPGRLNHHFKWEGATFCVDSACGSTASAVGLAYRALINRDCDTAIAGGSNIIATPFWHSALSKGGFLSQTGGCKTFREDADGYCRGEAIGVVVMKRLEDAIQDNDNIVSVIRGYARNHSADTVSITRPHVPTQERVYRSVLHYAGLEPNDIGYVEMHGTGTTAGDSAELESVVNILAQKGARESPLVVGAIKANVGHSEAASGISSIMKAAIMFRKGIIPPQVGMPEKLGKFDCLDQGSILIPGAPVQFSRQANGKTRKILVNNFDAAGGNSCFILEEPPIPAIKDSDPRSHHVVACSAHCPASFEQNKRRLLDFLTENPDTNLADLAYTSTARRMHHSLRSAYWGGSTQDIIDGLNRDLTRGTQADKGTPPVVFVFTGQGAHYAGMGADLFRTSPQFRATVSSLQRVSTAHGFPPFVHLISNPDVEMASASIVQIHQALIALEIALVELWKTWGIVPDLVIGHSIGEYAALFAAGVLSATDVMYLVGKRATLVHKSCTEGTHGMLSISGTAEEILALTSDENVVSNCEVACFNSPGMIVLSGERSQLQLIEDQLKERNIKSRFLDVPFAMHSCQMNSIEHELRDVANGLRFGIPRVKVISTLLGKELTEFNGDYLVRHTREPVKFDQAIAHSLAEHLSELTPLWLEIGPHPICLGLVRANTSVSPDRSLPSLKKGEKNWKTISTILAASYKAGKSLRWREYHQDFSNSLSLISLPKYAFETRNYWLSYEPGVSQADVQPISSCVHHLVKRENNGEEQTAQFKSVISQPCLLNMIEGHKLSGITVCPAGVFSEMALTAARYILTDGNPNAPFPAFSVFDTQIDHPIVPDADSNQVVQVNVSQRKSSLNELAVSIADQAKPSIVNSKCIIRLRDEQGFKAERQALTSLVQPKISKLVKAATAGLANRFQGKLFYRLFGNLMGYTEHYEGVKEAIVSEDFTEALATIQLPKLHGSDQSVTLSPYWIDALTHLAGFLFNGNPMSSADQVYIGTHMERMEIVASELSPDVRYQSYAYIEHPEGSDTYSGHVYILNGDSIVGFLEGARFRKMPRHTLHRILGKVDPPRSAKQSPGSSPPVASPNTLANGIQTNGHVEADTPSNGANSHTATLYSSLIERLLEETGMLEDELTPSTFFAEIGVDSLMSISILAAVKADTGVELGASFLMDHPTLDDAQRELRKVEKPGAGPMAPQTNGDSNGGANGVSRKCNVVLMQGPSSSSRHPLFLIADGAGSAAAYIHLPKLGQDLPVLAVESPWVHDPENFTSNFSDTADIYIAAIRAKQPRGPYLLGGWSAGGVFAYEVARRLLNDGEQVLGLIIIDITGPKHEDMSKVTAPTMEIIDQIGMLSGIERSYDDSSAQSRRLRQHMLSTVTCFSRMKPTSMAPDRRPDATFIIWATKDIMPKDKADHAAELGLHAWFYPSPHEFGPNGWDALVGNKTEFFQIEGDHFSIMGHPEVGKLGEIIREAVAKCS
ncbi:uncharacterized protein KD926_000107 [Aspergillus affinis]|uniref:uncharacterized protein n=1 Tax=Aspergillus affinis TaxID=1070780 RepID=UPI0022FE6D2B|nr:uncharacterized protein KD926_000107 [Aspergillus affinis]KAI9037691.1 hypothetical protein KD926_000107 [Aspergillus affinis]